MSILNTLLEIIIYSVIIFCATMIFKKTLDSRLSSTMHLALWALMLMRLLIPITVESSVHFFTIEEAAATNSVNAPMQQTQYNEPVNNYQPESTTYQNTIPDTVSAETSPIQKNEQLPVSSAKQIEVKPEHVLLSIWVLGMAVSVAMAVHSYRLLRLKTIRNAVWVPNEIYSIFLECKAELDIRDKVRISIQNELGSPALMFPSTVMLPAEMLGMDSMELSFGT